MSEPPRFGSWTARRRLFPALVLAAAALVSGCGDKGPTRPPPAGPFTECPADIEVDSPDGNAVAVNYGLPGASGGTPPYTIVCEPASGTMLGIGTHTVTCRATDATGRTAICSFNVRVVEPPRISHTRFLAFGDSITEGQVGEATTFGPRIVDEMAAYPTRLEDMLQERYRAQAIIVINAGCGGEATSIPSTHCPGGAVRLPGTIAASNAQVLLLMEGTNDMMGPDPQAAAERAIDALRDMVAYARFRGLRVFLATIPPLIAGGDKNVKESSAAQVPLFNAEIRILAAEQGAALVDVYAALRDRPELIGPDHVHPTRAGLLVIAETFYAKIREELELPGSGTTARR